MIYDSETRNITVFGGRNVHFAMPARPLPQIIKNEDDLDAWRAEHAAATLQVTDMENERRLSLARATVQQIREMDDKLLTARVRTERAAAVIADAEEQLARKAERERAAQPQRRAKHEAALKAHAEAERLMREVYGPAAATIGECLTKLVALRAEIDAANSDLPVGADPIPSPDTFRGYTGTETRYVDQAETYYVDPKTGQEIRPFRYTPKPVGIVQGESRYGSVQNGREVELVERSRTKQVKEQGRSAFIPAPLTREVVLPGLFHTDPAIWPVRA